MLFFVLVIVLAVSCGVRAGVDFNDCNMHEGWYGDLTYCDDDYLAVGACGSGAKADCSNNYHTLECCAITDSRSKKRNCEVKNGGYGEYIECSLQQKMTALCTSGLHESCDGEVTSIMCCDEDRIEVNDECTWRHGGWGDHQDCGTGWIMQGYCGSGDRYDCNGESHGVLCCQLAD